MWLIFQKIENYTELSWPDGVCPIAADWVGQLLAKDPLARLPWEGTRLHPFFGGINWHIKNLSEMAAIPAERNTAVAWKSAARQSVEIADANLLRLSRELTPDSPLHCADNNDEERERWITYLLPQEEVLREGLLRKHIFLHPTTSRRFVLLFSSMMNAVTSYAELCGSHY